MKRISALFFASLVLLSMGILGSGCDEKKPVESKSDTEFKVYRQAVELGDFITAINCINHILATDSTHKEYWDTLANLYYTSRMYMPALKTCQKWVSKYGYTTNILRIKGSSYEIIGEVDSARETYDKLYLMEQNRPAWLFKTALMHLQSGNQEGLRQMEEVRNAKNIKSDSVELFWQEQNYMQYVKLEAAIHWYDAFLAMQQRNIAKAKDGLIKAVKTDPNFAMARYYLENFEKGQR